MINNELIIIPKTEKYIEYMLAVLLKLHLNCNKKIFNIILKIKLFEKLANRFNFAEQFFYE